MFRLAVGMKLFMHIHIHIHGFSADIHGYINIPQSDHRCSFRM